jgi:hypothetical protein
MSDITISNANLFINGHYYGCKYSVFTAILATLQQKLSLFRYSVVLAEADEVAGLGEGLFVWFFMIVLFDVSPFYLYIIVPPAAPSNRVMT